MIKDPRTDAILETIMALARLDFSKRIELDENNDALTAISAGVNMLGEELRDNVVSLKEKEQLLKELHHRVKNNMQIIISLLKLQAATEDNLRFAEIIKDSEKRISAMALVHEMLYNTKDFAFTKFGEYVAVLSESLFVSYAPANHEIVIDLQIEEDIYFEIDFMIPLGLIINEMMSNSLKYAFKNNSGKILIAAKTLDDGAYEVVYHDDGVGLPSTFNLENAETLGMQLILMLTEQLQGNIEIFRNEGLGYKLKFY